jgi:hypothetical protein
MAMTQPSDPDQPTYGRERDPLVDSPEIVDPVVTEHVVPPQPPPVAGAEPTPVTTPTPVRTERDDESGGGAGGKVRAAAVLAAAAALANKVRQEAPKRVQEIRQKRVAGRCVILAEVDGRQVAIGPYRDDQAARQDVAKVTGVPTVIELVSPAARFGPQHAEGTAGG